MSKMVVLVGFGKGVHGLCRLEFGKGWHGKSPDHTFVKKRCDKASKSKTSNKISRQEKSLSPFVGNPREGQPEGIQIKVERLFGIS